MDTLLSIVTPSYNQAHFIEQTIDSVLTGKPNNVEYIVVDGNSTDGTKEILRKYEKYIDLIICEEDSGQSDAIIKGSRYSSGKWINWLNSDDYLEDNALNALVEELASQSDNVCIVSGNLNIVNGVGVVIDQLYAQAAKSVSEILLCQAEFVAPQPSTFVRRDVFWLRRSLHYIMDWVLYLEILDLYPGSMRTLDMNISNFRVHQESKTSTKPDLFSAEAKSFLSQKTFFGQINNKAKLKYLRKMLIYEMAADVQNNDSAAKSILTAFYHDQSVLLSNVFLSAICKRIFLGQKKAHD